MEIITLSVTDIDASNRLRPIDEDYAALIGASMAQYGQRAPVEVLPMRADGKYPLISGGHRWRGAAIHSLDVLAVVRNVDAIEAELLEIDENLARHDLNALDEAVFLQRRQEIWLKLYPETGHGRAKKKDDKFVVFVQSFAAATAEKLGVSERTVQRRIDRAKHLADAQLLDRVRGTWLARRGAYLDKLIALEPSEMGEVIGLLLHAGEGDEEISLGDAIRQVRRVTDLPVDAVQRDFNKLTSLWKRADISARKRFREFLAKEAAR